MKYYYFVSKNVSNFPLILLVTLIIVGVIIMGIMDFFFKSREEKVSFAELNKLVELLGEESAQLHEKQITQLSCLADEFEEMKKGDTAFFEETMKLLEDMESVTSTNRDIK